MPMLASTSSGDAVDRRTARRARRAMRSATSSAALGRRPSAAARRTRRRRGGRRSSARRSAARSRAADLGCSSWSPAWWPRVSLISLNRSRSSTRTARSLPLRLLASSACWTRSANMLRLGQSVSGSDERGDLEPVLIAPEAGEANAIMTRPAAIGISVPGPRLSARPAPRAGPDATMYQLFAFVVVSFMCSNAARRSPNVLTPLHREESGQDRGSDGCRDRRAVREPLGVSAVADHRSAVGVDDEVGDAWNIGLRQRRRNS